MRMSAFGFVGLAVIAPWYAVVSCGGQQASAPAVPVVETATASVAPAAEATPKEAAPAPSTAASASAAQAAPPPEESPGARDGETIGEANGVGGLGLSAGDAPIGLGTIGSLGHGAGLGTGGGNVFGNSRKGGTPPSLRQGAVTVSGALPPEVVQRIVRQNFGRFRACYETALHKSPKLEGRVTVGFTIDDKGAVQNARDAGSTLGDANTVSCIVSSFTRLSFPAASSSGGVKVTYPLLLKPGEPAPKAAPKPASSK